MAALILYLNVPIVENKLGDQVSNTPIYGIVHLTKSLFLMSMGKVKIGCWEGVISETDM